MAIEQMPSLASRFGSQLSAANAESKDKPVETGAFRRLPSGIRGGVAKVQVMEWSAATKDDGSVPKGELVARFAAVVLYPTHHGTEKIQSMQTTKFFPLCATPAGKPPSKRAAATFKENYHEFQNFLRDVFKVEPCPETPQSDPTGVKTEAYWKAVMQRLTNPKDPTYITFNTRGWTPPKLPGWKVGDPEPTEYVNEDWIGLADPELVKKVIAGTAPGMGVTLSDQASNQPPRHSLPPSTNGPVNTDPPSAPVTAPTMSIEDEVSMLIEVAMGDPDSSTPDGLAAQTRLEDLAWKNGWSNEQTKGAADWAEVGDMALNKYEPGTYGGGSAVVVGSKWLFAKRTKEGNKLKNNKGEELAAQEVEVLTVDDAAGTCTVKYTRDGKPYVDIRSKEPVPVKIDWLESF